MQYTKVAADAFQKLQLNAGILLDDFTPSTGAIGNIIGATTGGNTFNSNPSFEDFGEDVDNVPANTKQLKRITGYDPVFSGTFLTVTAGLAKQLVAAGVIDEEDATHIIPKMELTDSDFEDVWLVCDYSDKNNGAEDAGFIAIHVMNALNTTGFQLKTTKNAKGNFAFELHGHYDIADIDTVPFEIYVKAGTPTLAALTVTSEAGTSSGKSKITVSGYTLGSGESYVYQTAVSSAPSVDYGDNVGTWTTLTNGSEITPTASHTKITVAVKDSNSKAVGAGSATLEKAT